MSLDSAHQSIRPAPRQPVPAVRRRRGRWPVAMAALAALTLLATGCSTGPGSQEEFVEVLLDSGTLTEPEASCIAQAVFDEYETDEDALGKISAAPDFAYLSGPEGVEGFTEFFDLTIAQCAAVGPTPAN